MIITEQLYAILPSHMTGSVDWDKTYQTPDTARFSYDKTLFVISKPIGSDYLSDEAWLTQPEVYAIVLTEDFSGPNQSVSGSNEPIL